MASREVSTRQTAHLPVRFIFTKWSHENLLLHVRPPRILLVAL
jgi:hypothetical protein